MSYMTAIQVKNILAQKGFPRGKKSSSTNSPTGGVVTYPQADGWVQVVYANSSLAAKDNVPAEKHNAQMLNLIHFALTAMCEFEADIRETHLYGHYKSRVYLYRKAK
jgi:hypothetical protein